MSTSYVTYLDAAYHAAERRIRVHVQLGGGHADVLNKSLLLAQAPYRITPAAEGHGVR
jgi:hypothetical protein